MLRNIAKSIPALLFVIGLTAQAADTGIKTDTKPSKLPLQFKRI